MNSPNTNVVLALNKSISLKSGELHKKSQKIGQKNTLLKHNQN
jgi:hypothetical protein